MSVLNCYDTDQGIKDFVLTVRVMRHMGSKPLMSNQHKDWLMERKMVWGPNFPSVLLLLENPDTMTGMMAAAFGLDVQLLKTNLLFDSRLHTETLLSRHISVLYITSQNGHFMEMMQKADNDSTYASYFAMYRNALRSQIIEMGVIQNLHMYVQNIAYEMNCVLMC